MTNKIPRCPGIRRAPEVRQCPPYDGSAYRVVQGGFWMDSRIEGPVKPTQREAIAAWKRMLRAMAKHFAEAARMEGGE